MKNRKAFTLIELLVVIAIIALLMAIIMPALNNVKRQATGAVCMTRQKNLALGLKVYTNDYNGRLVGGNTERKEDWVYKPQLEGDMQDFNLSPNISTIENRIRGIERGLLYPYLDDYELYHCPGDRRIKAPEDSVECAYRSYSMPSGMDTRFCQQYGDAKPITKIDQVKVAGEKFCFVEEAEKERGYNHWSWATYAFRDELWDPLAIWHNKGSSFAFFDGHVEIRKWKDSAIINIFELGIKPGDPRYIYDATTSAAQEDISFIRRGFPHCGKK